MPNRHNNPTEKHYDAAVRIPLHRRVKLVGGKLYLAGASERDIGTSMNEAEPGEAVRVQMRQSPDNFLGEVTGVINPGDELFAASNGRLAACGLIALGVATSGAEVEGEWIEWLRN